MKVTIFIRKNILAAFEPMSESTESDESKKNTPTEEQTVIGQVKCILIYLNLKN